MNNTDKQFQPFDPSVKPSDLESDVLQFWRDRDAFVQSVSRRPAEKSFVFYEGPPTANGRPGIHHVLARTFKDIICRYRTMRGFRVERKGGWDTHGLPVELQVEKALGLRSKDEIVAYGVRQFNEACRQSVWEYKEEWERLTERMGYWEDLSDAYVTYSPEYIQSVWWGIKQIWQKGRIVEDYKVVPYCPRCGTALSLAEVAQGYKDVDDLSVYVRFRLTDEPATSLLAWTTTPWTLPGNVALAVGPKIGYVKIKQGEEYIILAEERLEVIEGDYEIVDRMSGEALAGRRYQRLFDFTDLSAGQADSSAYQVLTADFVTTEDGTGIVHTAVMYGEDDFQLGRSKGLPAVHTVDESGRFNQLVPPWQGQSVKEAEPAIIEKLTALDALYKTASINHSYPFCWRCSTALLYYARNSWFIKIDDDLRQRLLSLNSQINWMPEHLKDGRFGNWLEGLRDWSISRERFWGTPLPIWRCQNDRNHLVCVESIAELKDLADNSSSGGEIDWQSFDPHRPDIDEIRLSCRQCDGQMRRIPEVADVWLDSGSMPYAQWGYPLVNQDKFESHFPADFIAEGIDQTRGWFNSLLILAAIIFDRPAYHSVISPNLVLDEKGQKMSKSKGNVVDPWQVMEANGADALRFYFLTVNRPSEYMNFSVAGVNEVYRQTIMIWWNVVNFFLLYAGLDRWQPVQNGAIDPTVLDRWLNSRMAMASKLIADSLDNLDTFAAARELKSLIEDISTWYLRRSRKRRDGAFYQTLHSALLDLARIAAPFMPFTAEATYRALKASGDDSSVHWEDWPQAEEPDSALLDSMAQVRQLVTAGHAIRAAAGIKLRQPLRRAFISRALGELDAELLATLADELNVMTIEYVDELPSGTTRNVSQEGNGTLALDIELDAELLAMGSVRDIVRELQALRKMKQLQPGEPITVYYKADGDYWNNILRQYESQIANEVTARQITAVNEYEETQAVSRLERDGQSLQLSISRI